MRRLESHEEADSKVGDEGDWSCARSKAVSQLILEEAPHHVRLCLNCRMQEHLLDPEFKYPSETLPNSLSQHVHSEKCLFPLPLPVFYGKKTQVLAGVNCGTSWTTGGTSALEHAASASFS